MEKKIKYSVIMAAHRLDDYLFEAVKSVEENISSDAEFIIVVNGVNREEIKTHLLNFKSNINTFVVISDIPSLIYSLNKGVEVARGAYLARFDSDDICLPGRFEHQYRLASETGGDFIFSSALLINSDGAQVGRLIKSTTKGLWRRCSLIHPTAFIRREAIVQLGGYGNIEYSEDYHLWLRAKNLCFKFVADDVPTIKYRIHSGQATDRSKLMETFLTNIGVKLILSGRYRNASIFFGMLYDIVCSWYLYIKSKLNI